MHSAKLAVEAVVVEFWPCVLHLPHFLPNVYMEWSYGDAWVGLSFMGKCSFLIVKICGFGKQHPLLRGSLSDFF